MHDLTKIKSTVAHDPLPFLASLYGDAVKRTGNTWRVGSKGGRCFDTHKGELLCVTFNGDAGQGDCIKVWMAHHECDFPTAIEQIAALYGLSAGASAAATPPVPKPPRPDPEARLAHPLQPWPLLKEPAATLWHAAVGNLMANPAAQAAIAGWRGWPIQAVQRLASGQFIGYTEFDLWPEAIAVQPAAFFRIMHPEPSCEGFWHWHPVQLHIRFRSGARWQTDRPLSWIYAPTMKELGATDGAHAPLVLAHWGRDPEHPGYGTRCECLIVCAGEWDALTLIVLMEWIDETGLLTIPKGLAIVGIRSEGRGGTDSFLRRYRHWHPCAAILIGDADATGASWFASTDARPCFAEQLERRGMRVLARAPRPREGIKDVNDLYRAGHIQPHHIAEMLTEAGFPIKGDAE